jgi:hypothetical protein
LDDIPLFRAVVLVDQYVVALPDQETVDSRGRELAAMMFG